MIIPCSRAYVGDLGVQLASEMGLWVTHDHAKPLGARSLHEVFPGANARMPEETDRFVALYEEAIKAARPLKMVWSVGFRGQGDRPFYHNDDDSRYSDNMAVQGKIISEMIRLQQRMVRELAPGPHYFAHNLYAESVELYQGGYLDLDDYVIRVWGDNGFGAMCRRRPSISPSGTCPPCPWAPTASAATASITTSAFTTCASRTSSCRWSIRADPGAVPARL